MKTVYALCQRVVVMPDGVKLEFWFDGNSKITLGNGTFEQPAANAFSLVSVLDCPGATSICRSACYIHNLKVAHPEIYEKYVENSTNIRAILANPDYLSVTIWAFANYINEHCRCGFRWGVSGDIFSSQYAEFIAEVCKMTPQVPHWLYTRSFAFLGCLVGPDNLVVNLSVDRDNWTAAKAYVEKYRLRPCFLADDGEIPDDLPDDSVIFPSYNLRMGREFKNNLPEEWFKFVLTPRERKWICPADFWGQSKHFRCGVCKKCLKLFRP